MNKQEVNRLDEEEQQATIVDSRLVKVIRMVVILFFLCGLKI